MAMRSEERGPVRPRHELGAAVALFHSLSDATRLAIVQRLAAGEARVVDLTAELGLAQSTVSAHLACLRDCGLVDYRPRGRASVYFLTQMELMDMLRSAETLLAATGEAVALCPNYGTGSTSQRGTDESPALTADLGAEEAVR